VTLIIASPQTNSYKLAMCPDDQISFLMATVEALQLRLGALEAIITESPEAREKFDSLLRAAEKKALLVQQDLSHTGTLFQTKKPN
jgi:hypothetical protein